MFPEKDAAAANVIIRETGNEDIEHIIIIRQQGSVIEVNSW